MSENRFYITTPIYYPSADAHIGHAYCTVVCDVLARYKRLRGIETYFLTGTDEHGEKIQIRAKTAGVSEQAFVDDVAERFKTLWKALHITNDDFIRTTEKRHTDLVQKVFRKLSDAGCIYRGTYEGWYCTHCESFWTKTQVGEAHLCPDCHRPVHKDTEETYFFRTQKFLPDLLRYMDEHPRFVTPLKRKHEMLNTFIKPGLEDLSISRTSFDWGVHVEEDPRHVVYVWLDALVNYLSALGYLSDDDTLFQKFWQDTKTEIVHVVGADISRFHVIYWPMFLFGLGLRLPDRIFVHGLLSFAGEKMSKSKGNVVSPLPLIERYGVDAVRWFLVSEFTFGADGRFAPDLFAERINVDLANNFGNLVNRTLAMTLKYFDGIIPSLNAKTSELDQNIHDLTVKTVSEYEALMDDLQPTEAMHAVMDLLNAANRYIENTKPWVLKKNGEEEALANVIGHLVNVILIATIMLSPVLVESAPKVFSSFGVPLTMLAYENVRQFGIFHGFHVVSGAPLFPRLDLAKETAYIASISRAG